ncbi:MAG: FMN-binding negative transcriptional regulator [Saprospiraceae bacterium]|nr:FMN-binding negative transcriptional regulator [Saprospiraceae bacterium]MBP7679932.1 FMN-binding negative transcriptional regulator [Saprospiraceae bacterium]
MYIPPYFTATDTAEALRFMQQYSFATVIGVQSHGLPIATHLPVVAERNGEHIALFTHFSRANEQTNNITDQTLLVVFQTPHAYISTSHYEKFESVPTWNYIAVHAYGKAAILTDDAAFAVLEKTIAFYEATYQQQWDQLSAIYKNKMLRGITAVRIDIHTLQFAKKLSQNKTDNERISIIQTLSQHTDSSARAVAEWMQQQPTSSSTTPNQ